MGLVTYVNGAFVPKDEAKISVYDHGFLYGDGVFEGIRAYNGRIFRLDAHVDRLYESAKYVMLEIPLSKDAFAEAILETVRRSGLKDAYIRPVVSRGVGDLGLDPRKCSTPTVVIIVDTIQLYPTEAYARGLRLVTATTRKIRPDALAPQAKTLNYLGNILARLEANRAGVDEALMLSSEGYVCECSADNIFLVRDDEVWTPPVHLGILKGITRDSVMDLVRSLGMKMLEEVFTLHDVYTADECFLTGTGAEVGPVVEVDGRHIAEGTPGEVTQRLLRAFRELVAVRGTPIYTPATAERRR
jgi:branched-chain amino acid aminotransferase